MKLSKIPVSRHAVSQNQHIASVLICIMIGRTADIYHHMTCGNVDLDCANPSGETSSYNARYSVDYGVEKDLTCIGKLGFPLVSQMDKQYHWRIRNGPLLRVWLNQVNYCIGELIQIRLVHTP